MNKRGGGEKKKSRQCFPPVLLAGASVTLSGLSGSPWKQKKKKSTCLLEMLSLTPCSRAKIVRKKKNPDEGRGDAE